MNITEKEKTVLQLIAQNEYNTMNYGVPESANDTVTWCNCIDAGYIYDDMEYPSSASLPGIVASLVKKGLIDTNGETISHTDAGFEYWKSEVYRDEKSNDDENVEIGTPIPEVAIKNIIDYKGYGELFTLVTTSNGLEFPIDREQAEILHKQSDTFASAKADVLLRSVEQHLVK